MKRFVCIHGHFYQPPREDPWHGAVEPQESAAPYHDWNERITAECYAPLARAGVYERISYNFGPTLLGWLETADPATYGAVVRADAARNAALAQVFGHAILPLCNARDRQTQVIWGLRDFARRFGRPAKGLWLPETAVDRASLETLASCGVRFTLLAPAQAARTRPAAGGVWRDVGDGSIDPKHAYRCRLPSGNTIDLFFYDGPLSAGVAFGELGQQGEQLAARLAGVFNARDPTPQLVHIATDGETYGHHRAGGARALALALDRLDKNGEVRLTHYAEFLDIAPVLHEVEIVENSSWSCAHGLGRWSEDCGCTPYGAWRAPLRRALDWLRDELAPRFESRAAALLRDPWAARDDYVDLLPVREADAERAFLERHARRELVAAERREVWSLLELQRHCLLMYTSCGWFFEHPARIETRQILRYAARAVELGQELFGVPLEPRLLELLPEARGSRRLPRRTPST